MIRLIPLISVLALGACDNANPDYEARLTALEDKVEELSNRPAPGAAPQQQELSPHEQEAFERWQLLMGDYQEGNIEKVLEHIAIIERDFADTPALQAIESIKEEYAVIGTEPPPLQAEEWLTGAPTSYTDGKATLVVFWEVWCPHCRREVPEIEQTYARLRAEGLNVIGLTQLSNDTPLDEVKSFLDENQVTYPTARVGAGPSDAFKVSGIPAAAVVKDGKIVWRGHPRQLSDDDLRGFMGS
ncbi:MAG: hypothetical protein EA397_00890 [Deltaproteobacteria bacterium]|nr:MAG: hypothetical protein EA397_00890 [Deltaproteobacteria bacterium]